MNTKIAFISIITFSLGTTALVSKFGGMPLFNLQTTHDANQISPNSLDVDSTANSLLNISNDIRQLQKHNNHQRNETIEKYTVIIDSISKLEKRISNLEISQNHVNREKMATAPDQNIDNKNERSLNPGHLREKPTENDIGNWIDQSIEFNNIDTHASQLAMSDLTESINNIPGTSIESLHCGDGFCRTELQQENGKNVDISAIIGLPPFTGSGFSKPGEDGKTTFYFTQAGVSMEDLEERLSDNIQP